MDDLLEDLFAPLGGVSIRRMFGGIGVFKDGLMFALRTSDGTFCFRADDETAKAFAAEGCSRWTPVMKGRAMLMPYWQAPERLFDEPQEFAAWARTAFDVALADRAGKTKPKKPAAKKPAAEAAKKTAPKRR